jgi:hypothetical protein
MEQEYLKELLHQLNSICEGWELGDIEDAYKKVKSADVVNHKEKLAIEVKDDFSEMAPELSSENPIFQQTRNLETLSNRYRHDIEDAHKKFKNYDGYETAVLIRFSDFTFTTIYYLLGGLVRLTQHGRIPNTDKNISRNCSTCSLFSFLNIRNGKKFEFYRNPLSKRGQDKIVRVIQKLYADSKEITSSDFLS